MSPSWWLYAPGVLIVLGWVATYRWLVHLQRRVDEHADRISRLEGWRDHNNAG